MTLEAIKAINGGNKPSSVTTSAFLASNDGKGTMAYNTVPMATPGPSNLPAGCSTIATA